MLQCILHLSLPYSKDILTFQCKNGRLPLLRTVVSSHNVQVINQSVVSLTLVACGTRNTILRYPSCTVVDGSRERFYFDLDSCSFVDPGRRFISFGPSVSLFESLRTSCFSLLRSQVSRLLDQEGVYVSYSFPVITSNRLITNV